MNPHTQILEQFGLSRNDIKTYDELLRLGRSKTGPIIKETNIASSRVYASLRKLVAAGLVSYQVKNNVKYYQAELPHDLIDRAEQNVSELKSLSKDLVNFPITPQSRNDTNVYEGLRGFKMAYEQHIAGMERGETAMVIVHVGSEFAHSTELRAFFSEKIDREMIKKKCRGHMITNVSVDNIIQKDRPDSSIYDIRYLSPRYMLPYALNITSKEVMISVWDDKPVAFTIKNPTVIKGFKKHFEFLWGLAKKK